MKKNINKTEENEKMIRDFIRDEVYETLEELIGEKDEIVWRPMTSGDRAISFSGLMSKYENSNLYFPVAIIRHDGFPEMVFYNFYTGSTRYLVPFRGYCFQMCGTRDGQNDCGSNEVVGLNNVLTADYGKAIESGCRYGTQSNIKLENIGKYMLRTMAEACIAQAMWQSGVMFEKTHGYFENNGMSVFIDLCVEFAQKQG